MSFTHGKLTGVELYTCVPLGDPTYAQSHRFGQKAVDHVRALMNWVISATHVAASCNQSSDAMMNTIFFDMTSLPSNI